MDTWVVIIGLLALAIIFLFISLFLKDNNYEEELDEMSESLLELNRELYYLKKKFQEMEGTPRVMHAPQYQATEYTAQDSVEVAVPEVEDVEPVVEALEVTETFQEVEPVVDSKKLHNITKQHIITLYSQGCEMDEISEQLSVPMSTVQSVIENYFEVDPE
ncbi:hypothetical protein SAMN05421767_1294 [Granulicatella balaenopterae]|uniref:Uncharacterized protein n=1 Tax=Granulicatella balaenopterae TaxID=137733 RepID=A0A1H9MQ13_9LACT|nr:hypothetical protein [Granulicatella balaenopterae]SER25718.1 hypothetical protein SAMN05421767_1294 [Granulicatella balaenopterae]